MSKTATVEINGNIYHIRRQRPWNYKRGRGEDTTMRVAESRLTCNVCKGPITEGEEYGEFFRSGTPTVKLCITCCDNLEYID